MTTVKDYIIDYKEALGLLHKAYLKGELTKEDSDRRLEELFEELMENIEKLFNKALGSE